MQITKISEMSYKVTSSDFTGRFKDKPCYFYYVSLPKVGFIDHIKRTLSTNKNKGLEPYANKRD